MALFLRLVGKSAKDVRERGIYRGELTNGKLSLGRVVPEGGREVFTPAVDEGGGGGGGRGRREVVNS